MTKYMVAVGMAFIVALMTSIQAEAASIHLRYFESADVLLDEYGSQLFSFSPLQDELVTIVAYGLDEDVQPQLTLLDPVGTTLMEDLNTDGNAVAYLQITISETGMYPFVVSRQREGSGLIRVMLFRDDPLSENITLLDTADPSLPSRAFLAAGDSANPIIMEAEVVPPDDQSTPIPQFFVSRGNTEITPPLDERTTPVERSDWLNDNANTLYTLNVRPIPEPNAGINFQNTGIFDFLVKIGRGSEIPVRVERPICTETVTGSAVNLSTGPGTNFRPAGQVGAGTVVEITGTSQNGDWLQVVDANRPIGHSWIPTATTYDITRPDCQRVQPVVEPTANNPALATLLAKLNNLNSQNEIIVALDFSCAETDVFVLAYNAIAAKLGTLMPDIEYVLSQLLAVSCNVGSGGNALPGTLPNTGGGGFGNAILSGNVVPGATGCANTVILQNSPAGEANQPLGSDDYTGTDACENIYGNDNPNIIDGSGGDDVILTYGGNDIIRSGAGNDVINAGAGDDLIFSGAGDDIIDGDTGVDTYDATDNSGSVIVNLQAGTATGSLDILLNIENINTGSGNDNILGDNNDNVLNSGAGNDVVDGGGGNDTILGGAGNDTLYTSAGVDTIDGGDDDDLLVITGANEAGDSVDGGAGNNRFQFLAGTTGPIQLISTGTDTLDFSLFGIAINIDLANNTAQNVGGGLTLTLNGTFENLIGTILNDILNGNAADNIIHGLNGDDVINGQAGMDTIFGGTGSDTIEGGNDPDQLYGGWDNSACATQHDVGSDIITDNGGSQDVLYGGNYNDTCGVGSDGNDTIIDNGGNGDELHGGNDNTNGGSGTDGSDSLTDNGGSGDVVVGGNNNHNSGLVNNNLDNSDGGQDILNATGASDTMIGGNENSGLVGGAGYGDDGDDQITHSSNARTTIFGGNNNLQGGVGEDGNDQISDSGGADDLIAGGNFNYFGGTGNDGSDTIAANGTISRIYGGNLNHNVGPLPGSGNDNVDGGVDIITANDGDNNDTVYGDNQNMGAGTGVNLGSGETAGSVGTENIVCDAGDSVCSVGNQ